MPITDHPEQKTWFVDQIIVACVATFTPFLAYYVTRKPRALRSVTRRRLTLIKLFLFIEFRRCARTKVSVRQLCICHPHSDSKGKFQINKHTPKTSSFIYVSNFWGIFTNGIRYHFFALPDWRDWIPRSPVPIRSRQSWLYTPKYKYYCPPLRWSVISDYPKTKLWSAKQWLDHLSL